jgi:hypothetical protein
MDETGSAGTPQAQDGPRTRARTYARWLEDQTGRQDSVGWLARAFVRAGADGSRTRLSSVTGITRWWQDNADKLAIEPDKLDQAIGQARKEFLRWQSDQALDYLAEGQPVLPQGVREQVSPGQRTDEQIGSQVAGAVQAAYGQSPGQGSAPPPGAQAAAGGGQGSPHAQPGIYGGGGGYGESGASGSPGPAGEILSVIYGQLSRIEGYLVQQAADQRAVMEQQAEMAASLAEVMRAEIAGNEWRNAQDERLAPLMGLIEDLQAADDAEGQALADGDDPAMERARDDAGELRDLEGRLQSQLPPEVHEWRGGMHYVHCRDDRCHGGSMCDCPCHVIFEGYGQDQDPAWQGVPDEAGPPGVSGAGVPYPPAGPLPDLYGRQGENPR